MVLALRAHEGQTRKDASVPYIAHPVRVAILLARYGFPDEVIAASLVHDVVEDTSVSIEDVRRELGDGVAALIVPVTEDKSLAWEERKKAYIETVHGASNEAKAISVADKIANAESLISAHAREGSEIWKRFSVGREKKMWFEETMLEMLQESWQHSLIDSYAKFVTQLKELE